VYGFKTLQKVKTWLMMISTDQGRRIVPKGFCWTLPESLMSSSQVSKTGCQAEVNSASFPQRQQLTECFWVKPEVSA